MQAKKDELGISDRFKSIRIDLNLTQAEFANKLGIAQNYISKIETGRKQLDTRIMHTLVEIFQIDINWILTGRGQKNLFLTNKKDNNSNEELKKISEDTENKGRTQGCKGKFAGEEAIEIILNNLKGWITELARKNPKRINWFECILEDKIPEYREWAEKEREMKNE
ncbi:MAG: XRE family transcriptional regulator [Candidatus Electrothrix sp. AR3]|nr:XRE family transcriptional regulator [Candidatus Electrothrix sp. AR3]